MLTNHRLSVDEYLSVHTEICYCESLIFPDGTICDCIPSHEIALARASCFTFDELRELIPMSASPVEWLVECTGCVAVWYDYCIASLSLTDAQLDTVRRLNSCDVTNIRDIKLTYEKTNTDLLGRLDNGDCTIEQVETILDNIRKECLSMCDNLKDLLR